MREWQWWLSHVSVTEPTTVTLVLRFPFLIWTPHALLVTIQPCVFFTSVERKIAMTAGEIMDECVSDT